MLTQDQINNIRNQFKLPSTNQQNYAGKYDYLLQSTSQEEESFLNSIGSDLRKRFTNLKDILSKTASGKINPVSTGVQTVGQVAGFANDVIGAGLNKITPEPVKEGIGKVVTKATESDIGKSLIGSYEAFKSKHPEAAKDLEGIVNIASLFPVGKGGQLVGKGIKRGAEITQEGVGTAIKGAGSVLEKSGEVLYKNAIPLNMKEAGIVQTYKANNPLLKRLFEPFETQPRTTAITALDKGFSGTEEMLGIQAKREAKNLWQNKIKPALQSVQQKYNIKDAISRIEKNIKELPEPSRRAALKDAVDALKADYKNINQVTYVRAQQIKSGLDKFTPDKVFRGKPVAGAFAEVKNMLANDIRKSTYQVLSDIGIKDDFLDYGNLTNLIEFGKKAMTSGGRKAGFGSFVSNLWDRATIPVFTTGGKLLNQAGKAIKK